MVSLFLLLMGFCGLIIQLEGSMIEFEAAKVTERLKRLVYGSNSDMELQKEKQWWDEFPSDDLDY